MTGSKLISKTALDKGASHTPYTCKGLTEVVAQFANFGGAWSEIIIRIEDPTDYGGQLIGKQRISWLNDADLQFEVAKRDNAGKDVTPAAPIVSPPVSGLWSTVWIEATPAGTYIISAEAFPNLDTWVRLACHVVARPICRSTHPCPFREALFLAVLDSNAKNP